MPPDLRAAAPGDIDSSMLNTSTNRLLLQSWLPDGGSTHALAHRPQAPGVFRAKRRVCTHSLPQIAGPSKRERGSRRDDV